ncbi:MAG: CDP-archaeol synthase [Planctomycetota bacterium]|nr:CDP-archaeol synthase [Planctomycetota bacterium]
MNVDPSFANVMYTVLPVTLANVLHMFVVKKKLLSSLNAPIDRGISWRQERIFGNHKTWRGLVVIVLGTCLFTLAHAILEHFAPQLTAYNLIDYSQTSWWQVGLWWGGGYALAELPNSFVKRRMSVAAGQGRSGLLGAVLVFVDQADSAVGVALASLFGLGLNSASSLWMAAYCTILHLAVNFTLGFSNVRTRSI